MSTIITEAQYLLGLKVYENFNHTTACAGVDLGQEFDALLIVMDIVVEPEKAETP